MSDGAPWAQWMREDWDRRARENAQYYVESSRDDWTADEFYSSGVESVRALVLDDAERLFGGRDPKILTMLEIGCGVGRMTRAFADAFGEVHGVDVSGEMIRQAREALEDRPNAHVHHGSGGDLEVLGEREFDFAFSFIVFQHIPDIKAIERYVADVSRLLKPGGVFKFQVHGGWRSPREQRDTWMGCRISAQHILEWFRRFGLQLFHFEGVGSQYFRIWARKPGPSCADAPAAGPGLDPVAEASLLEQELAEKTRWIELLRKELAQTELLGEHLEQLNAELEDRTAWAHQLDRQLESYAEHLRQIYRSPAYRIGRRLGLAPEPYEAGQG